MKNPFKKNDHKLLITGIVIGSVAAGVAASLFFTETGSSIRQQLAGRFSRIRGSLAGREPEQVPDHTGNYLKHKVKKPKTDREALLKHEILGGEHHHAEQETEQNQPTL